MKSNKEVPSASATLGVGSKEMNSSSSSSQKNTYPKIRDLKFEELGDKLTIIKPKDSKVRNHWKDAMENIGGNWKVNKGGWIVPTHRLNDLNEIAPPEKDTSDEKSRDENKDDSDYSDDDYSDSESSTDDEMIQKVLARRLKSESTQDEIMEENISDSENEDVLSLCRRLRHLYKEINSLKEELKAVHLRKADE